MVCARRVPAAGTDGKWLPLRHQHAFSPTRQPTGEVTVSSHSTTPPGSHAVGHTNIQSVVSTTFDLAKTSWSKFLQISCTSTAQPPGKLMSRVRSKRPHPGLSRLRLRTHAQTRSSNRTVRCVCVGRCSHLRATRAPCQVATPRHRFKSHSPLSFADVEANEEFKTDDQEKSTFERQPSVSRTDTSCAGARIVAESDQSRSRHNSMKPLQTNTLR